MMTARTIDRRVGDELKAAREAHLLSLEEVSQMTRIPVRTLSAIEDGRLEDLPAPVFANGFVRTYAQQLDLDAAELARRFQKELQRKSHHAALKWVSPSTGEMTSSTRMSIGIALVILCVVFALAFAFIVSPRRQKHGIEVSDGHKIQQGIQHACVGIAIG